MYSQTGQNRSCKCDGKILILEGHEFDLESRYNFSVMPRRAAARQVPPSCRKLHLSWYVFLNLFDF